MLFRSADPPAGYIAQLALYRAAVQPLYPDRPVRAYLVTEPTLIRTVLVRDAADYDKGFQFDALRGLIGDGVGTSGGAKHRRQKKLLRTAFDHSAVDRYAVDMVAQTAGFLDSRWMPALAADDPVDAAADMRMLAMRLVTHSMSGSEVAADEVMGSLPELLSGVGRRALLPVRALDRVPTPGNRRFDRSLASVHALADSLVAQHRRRAALGESETGPQTLLSLLLDAVDEDGTGMTDEQAHDEIMTLLLAGTETAAGVMAWALNVLARDSALQQRVRDEVLETTGGRPPTASELRGLALTRRVVQETLRLYPPGWIVGRTDRCGTCGWQARSSGRRARCCSISTACIGIRRRLRSPTALIRTVGWPRIRRSSPRTIFPSAPGRAAAWAKAMRGPRSCARCVPCWHASGFSPSPAPGCAPSPAPPCIRTRCRCC